MNENKDQNFIISYEDVQKFSAAISSIEVNKLTIGTLLQIQQLLFSLLKPIANEQEKKESE